MSRMRWRRCAMVVTLACGCFHPTSWSPEGQRLMDEREGRLRAPEPVEPAEVAPSVPPEAADGGVAMGYAPTVLNQVRVGPGEEWTAQGYSDHGLPIGAEATCPPKKKLLLTVTDARGRVITAAHLLGIYVARKQDVGGYFTVRLKNLESEAVFCDVKIIALLVADP
jgi:hypothetical protein